MRGIRGDVHTDEFLYYYQANFQMDSPANLDPPNVRIIVEGADGTGKTSATKGLVKMLQNWWGEDNVRYVKFPTEYPPEDMSSHDRTEFHLEDFRKALEDIPKEGVTVFDRAFLSTAIYQGYKLDEDGLNQYQDGRYINVFHNNAMDIMERGLPLFTEGVDKLLVMCLTCHPAEAFRRVTERWCSEGAEYQDLMENMVGSDIGAAACVGYLESLQEIYTSTMCTLASKTQNMDHVLYLLRKGIDMDVKFYDTTHSDKGEVSQALVDKFTDFLRAE